jgi:phosphoribosylamine---glycine ligase
VPFADEVFMQKVKERIIEPTINGFNQEGFVYKGFVFIGLIKVNNEPYVIEYNCRMGDPETEVVIPRLKNDLVEMLVSTAKGEVDQIKIEQDPRFAVTMVAVSGGYPGDYIKGYEIKGLDQSNAETVIFHSGTMAEDDKIVSNGGRVLTVTSFGKDVAESVARSKQVLEGIRFMKMYYRSDIGFEFMGTN